MQRIATLSHADGSDARLSEQSMTKVRNLWGHTERKHLGLTIMRESEQFSARSLEVGLRGVWQVLVTSLLYPCKKELDIYPLRRDRRAVGDREPTNITVSESINYSIFTKMIQTSNLIIKELRR